MDFQSAMETFAEAWVAANSNSGQQVFHLIIKKSQKNLKIIKNNQKNKQKTRYLNDFIFILL